MRNSVRKALPLTLAVLLAVSGAVFAGDNANAVLSLSQDTFSGVAASESFDFTVSAAGVVGFKQLSLTISLTPEGAFNLGAVAFAPGANTPISPGLTPDGGVITGGGADFSGDFTGDADLGVWSITMADDYDGSEVTIQIDEVSIGKSSSDFDLHLFADNGLMITINPPDPPDPPPVITGVDPASGPQAGGTAVTITGENFQDGATVTFGGTAAAVTFEDATSLTATSPAGNVGPVDVVVTNPDEMSATASEAFTYLELIEPVLSATSDTDASLDYSLPGSGDTADGSDGEVTFSVGFTDDTGDAGAGQEITWTITNNGSESVFLLPEGVEIEAGTTEVATSSTGDDGSATATFDSEGDKAAGTTSISVVASTTADNSDGESRELSQTFAATWDVAVAAELASITAEFTLDREVFLQWAVASQSNNLGWEVYRSVDQIHFEQVGDLVSGDGTVDGFRTYNFMDNDLPQADVLYYYLKQLDLDGTSARSDIIEVLFSSAVVQLPTVNALWQNFPNPFNPETIISFDLIEGSVVTLTIYDTVGQVVQTLARSQDMRAGHHQLVWNGLDVNGIKVSSGVYFYQLRSNNFTSMKKMTLLQ